MPPPKKNDLQQQLLQSKIDHLATYVRNGEAAAARALDIARVEDSAAVPDQETSHANFRAAHILGGEILEMQGLKVSPTVPTLHGGAGTKP